MAPTAEPFSYHMNPDVLRDDLRQRWIIERGLEAGAELILEVGDHILSSQFVHYADTYEYTSRRYSNRA